MNEKKIIDDISFVLRSPTRRRVLSILSDGHLTPKLLSRRLNIAISQISYALHTLSERNLVECINEDAKRGRIYQITKRGERIHMEIEHMMNRINQND